MQNKYKKNDSENLPIGNFTKNKIRKIMLDALSRPKQVSKEMNEDWDGAMYWFYKKQGREKEVKKKTIKLN